MLRHFLLRLLFLSLAFASTAGAAAWPEASSDLPPDPALRSGTLENGLRYILLHNSEPRDRVSMRLLVQVGSLQERDDERGLAHFLEHMVFRGTKRHPDGALTTELQRLGIGFGPDNTAFTHYDHTIYHLDLPDTKESTLRQGLGIFREYAEEVTFDPTLIERERGVVLSEMNTRDTPAYRVAQSNLAFLWPQSRQANRSPIGLESAIRHFTREQFVSFYDDWYRPERMAVVIVGEVKTEEAERVLREVFGSLKARGKVRDDPAPAIPAAASRPDIQVFTDPNIAGASCTFEHPLSEPKEPETHAQRVRELHQGLAFTMFQRRLLNRSNGVKSEFVDPSADVATPLPGWRLTNFTVSGSIANWKEFMTDLEREHRAAFLHGFTAAELRTAKTVYQRGLDDAVRTSPTRSSTWLAEVLASGLVDGTVFSTPQTWQNELSNEVETATPKQCLDAFRAAWTTRQPHVFIITNPQFSVQAATIAQALNESRGAAVRPLGETKVTDFAYTNFGAAAASARLTDVADLEIRQAEYPNGTRLNFKATNFEADTVQVYVRVGEGRLSQPESKPGLDLLANAIVSRGGLRRHTFEELQDLFSGHSIGLNFYVDSDAFAFNARCARRDLAFCLQVIAAHLTDSAYRPEALREINASFGSMYTTLAAAAGGPINTKAERILARGDRRFGVPLPDELFARTIDEVRAWVEPQFKSGAIELSIVGETNWNEVNAAVSQTFGALPSRSGRSPTRTTAQPHPGKPAKAGYVYTTAPQLHQVALARFCPASDLKNIYEERRCRMLADVIEERLRVRLREELGAAYSSSASFVQHEGFPGLTYFMVYAEVSPAQARQAAVLISKELEALSKKHLTDDEFERARQPFLRSRQDDLRTNGYWGYTVLRDAQQNPERLIAARNRTADTAAITRKELEQLAKRYLKPDRSFEFVSYPSGATR